MRVAYSAGLCPKQKNPARLSTFGASVREIPMAHAMGRTTGTLLPATKPSLIRTLTVGLGITPNQRCCARGLLPPVGTFTPPRRFNASILSVPLEDVNAMQAGASSADLVQALRKTAKALPISGESHSTPRPSPVLAASFDTGISPLISVQMRSNSASKSAVISIPRWK
jgi:hypothetical protein